MHERLQIQYQSKIQEKSWRKNNENGSVNGFSVTFLHCCKNWAEKALNNFAFICEMITNKKWKAILHWELRYSFVKYLQTIFFN